MHELTHNVDASANSGYRNFRDPVHNIISLDTDTVEGALLNRLIDSSEVQRLRRIRQVGLAYFAYQGAEHSRFAHSIGTMHLSQRMLARIERRVSLSRFEKMATMAAALLHDVGHGPFSHTIEPIARFRHETWTLSLLTDPTSSLNQILTQVDRDLPAAIVHILQGTFSKRFLCQVVSSQFDCDRLDYLLRDSLMTGVSYGHYDLEWLLSSLEVDPAANTLFIRAKGLHAIEEFIQSRNRMFRQLYFHHLIKAAEAVFSGAIERAVELFQAQNLGTDDTTGILMNFLIGNPLTVQQYLSLDDVDILWHLKRWALSPDPELSDLATRFSDRRMFKTLDIPPDMTDETVEQILHHGQALVAGSPISPHRAVTVQLSRDIPYFRPGSGKHPILVERGSGKSGLADLVDVSEIVASIQPVRLRRLCCVGELRPAISALLKEHQP